MHHIYELKRITTPKGKRLYYIDNKRVSELTYNRIDAGWLSCDCSSTTFNRNLSQVDCKTVKTTKTI